jgi:hypothetical protein
MAIQRLENVGIVVDDLAAVTTQNVLLCRSACGIAAVRSRWRRSCGRSASAICMGIATDSSCFAS